MDEIKNESGYQIEYHIHRKESDLDFLEGVACGLWLALILMMIFKE